MTRKVKYGLLITILILGITYLIIGCVRTNSDKVLEKNAEYILVKEYKWNNRDSVICKYPADKIYTGVVIDKKRTSYYVGVPGKGGHPQTRKHVTVQFNGRTLQIESSSLYSKYNEGDRIKVKEVWYPSHDIIVL